MKTAKKLTLAVVVFTLLVATASAITYEDKTTVAPSSAATASRAPVAEPKAAPDGDIVLRYKLRDNGALKLKIESGGQYIMPPTGRVEKIPGAGLIVHPTVEKPLVFGTRAPGTIIIEKGTKVLSNFTIRVPFELKIDKCDVSLPAGENSIYLYNCRGGEAVLQIKKRPPRTKELKLVKPDVIINGSRAVFPGFEVVKIASMKTVNLPNPRLVKITVSASEPTMWQWYVVDKFGGAYYIYDGDRAILATYKGDSAYAFFPEANTTVKIEVWGKTDYRPQKVEEFTATRAFYLAFPRDVPVFAQKDGYTATFYLQPRYAAIYQIAVVEEG